MNLGLLTPRQVADRLGVNYRTACQLIASGELPASNVSGGVGTGRRWRVSETDLARWLEGRKTA